MKPRSRNDGRVKEHRPEWDSSTDVPTRPAPTVEIHGTAAAGSANSWNSPFAGTYYDLILKEAEQMRNFSLAGGMSGIITQESSRPPRASSSRRKQRKKARRPQRNQGFDPLAQVTEKLNRASAEAITGPFVQPGDWQPTMGQPPRSPFRNVYSAFGSSTASPRHGQQESGWLWFGREVDQPPSATAAAEVIKRSTSVPNPLAARATPQDRLSARPATAGSTNASSLGQHAAVTPRRRSQDQASSGSLRAWKRSDEPLSGQRASSAHGTRRLRRLPPKGRADLAVYSPQRARSASGRRHQHRRWPQAAFAGTRATLLDVPKHGVALAHKVDERVFVPSPQQYDADRPWRTGVLARAKSAPSYTVGKRLKSKHEMALATGHTDPPAPGAQVKVPSFVAESKALGKGVVFGHKLDSPRTIMERLGYLEGPAPGGDAPLPSFVRENKSGAKGVAWTPPVDSPAVARYEARLAQAQEWRGQGQKQSKEELGRQGTMMLKDVPYPSPEPRLGPDDPPESFAPPPSFVRDGQRERKGVVFGGGRKPFFNIEEGTPAPGGSVKVPSFVEDARRERKGAVLGHRHKSRKDIEERLGIPQTPGVGHYRVETKPVMPVVMANGFMQVPSTDWGGTKVKKVFDRATT